MHPRTARVELVEWEWGVAGTFSGELNTANAAAQNLNTILETPLPAIAGGGTTTSMTVAMSGTLVHDRTGDSAELSGNLSGTFYGSDGAAIAGATAMSVRPQNGATSVLTGVATPQPIGGQFYTDKQ